MLQLREGAKIAGDRRCLAAFESAFQIGLDQPAQAGQLLILVERFPFRSIGPKACEVDFALTLMKLFVASNGLIDMVRRRGRRKCNHGQQPDSCKEF